MLLEGQKRGNERKALWCSLKTTLKIIFSLALLVLVIELIIVVKRPEPLPASLVLPSVKLFRKIHAPGKNLAYLYTLRKANSNVREGQFSENLEQIQDTVNTMIQKIQSLDGPLFPHERNTSGIVMTCKLGPLCLANLHHLFDNMNTSLPVGLSPPLLFCFCSMSVVS